MNRDVRLALAVVWMVVSSVTVAAAITPWFLDHNWLLSLAPQCSAAARGSFCSLCGMSRAFVAISDGDWAGARGLNPASPWLYGGFLLNAAAAAIWSCRKGFSWKFSA